MSIKEADDTTTVSKVLTYLGITFTFQLLGLITVLIYSEYFNKSATFAQSFLFRSSDSSPVAPGFHVPQPFGNHFFGDYLWIYSEIKTNGLGGYFGASQLYLLVATKLPYYFSLIGLFITSLLVLYLAARLLLRELGFNAQLALLTVGILCTQPVLLAIDRGQIHLLLFALLLLGLTLAIKEGGDKTLGAVLIAVAISIKLTPVFFLLLFVRKAQWKELKVGLISLAGFLLLPIAYLHSGIGAWKYVLGLSKTNKNLSQIYSSPEYFTGNLAYNSSFKLLAYQFSQMNSGLGNVGNFMFEHYFLFAGFLSIFFCWLITRKSVTQFESVLLMAIASSLLIPIASGYTLMVFILPIVVVILDADFIFTRLNIIYCCFIGIVLMPKQIAIGFGAFEDFSITLGGILNPSLCLLVIVFITGKYFFLAKETSPKIHKFWIRKSNF